MIFSESQNVLFPKLVWWCSIMSQSVMWEFCCCCYIQGQVTAKVHMFKIWLFLLYFLNCWFLCNQTWSNDASWARVSCEKTELLHLGSQSQRRVKMLMFVQMISSKPPNILFPNLVLWSIIMSWRVMQKDLFAIFKVRVTARAHDQNFTVTFELLILLLPD